MQELHWQRSVGSRCEIQRSLVSQWYDHQQLSFLFMITIFIHRNSSSTRLVCNDEFLCATSENDWHTHVGWSRAAEIRSSIVAYRFVALAVQTNGVWLAVGVVRSRVCRYEEQRETRSIATTTATSQRGIRQSISQIVCSV